MVARTPVEAGRPIPIRAVNSSDNRVTLQKGLQIERYHPVLRVVRREEEPSKPSKGKAKKTSVEELFLEGWKRLTDEQIKKAKAFIRTESDAFATADEATGRTQHRTRSHQHRQRQTNPTATEKTTSRKTPKSDPDG
jgi:hypothetical protein